MALSFPPARSLPPILRDGYAFRMIELVPMRPEELSSFLDRMVPDYAESHVRSGQWSTEEAPKRARAEIDHLLPQGVDSPDQFLRLVRDPGLGRSVGEVWCSLRKQDGPPTFFVYWIGIAPSFRRKGYASEAFREVEAEARRQGAVRVALHVFGENVAARALYEKLGYGVTNLIMAKAVLP